METKTVQVGSKVTVEIYQGRVSIDRERSRTRFLRYERFFQNDEVGYVEKYLIARCMPHPFTSFLHPESFAGRALMGAMVGDEVKVNVGGLRIDELPVGRLSGNHIMYKIVAIE